MAKLILFAAGVLILGVVIGNGVARYTAQRHQHTRAVMALAQFHLEHLAAAARNGQCPDFLQERERLQRVRDELLQAFPLAYAQDAEFRTRAVALESALQSAGGPAHDCASAGADAKKIHDACDDCHHEYR